MNISRSTTAKLSASTYLKHDNTDLLYTLDYGLWSASNSDGPLRGVGEHVSCHLYLSTCRLENTNDENRDKR